MTDNPTPPHPHQMSGWLKVQVLKGRNLLATDTSGFSDPFVRVSLDGASAPLTTVEGGKAVTARKLVTLNPNWNETFNCRVSKKSGSLRFAVWDQARIGDDTFMGRATIEVGLASEMGSAGEAVLKLVPREGNSKDEAAFKKSGFGELHVRWFWTYSTLGQLLSPDDVNKEEDVPLQDFETAKLTNEVTRFSNTMYALCLPWFWLNEKFMWENPFESLFVLYVGTYVCVNDLLLEVMVLTLAVLMIKWLVFRAMYGYYGKPITEVPTKMYPDPFAWMRDYENLTLQLQTTQNACAAASDLCDYVREVLTWERQDTSLLLTQFLLAWTVCAYFSFSIPCRYILLASFWYMFTYYPLMMQYPRLYKKVEPGALFGTVMGLISPQPEDSATTSTSAPVEEEEVVEAKEEANGGAKCDPSGVYPCFAKILEMKAHTAWEMVQNANGVRYEKAKVDSFGATVIKISGDIEASSAAFGVFISEADNVPLYDPLIDKVDTLAENPDGSKVMYTSFKSPVMFVTPRDFVSHVKGSLISPEAYQKYNLSCTPAPEGETNPDNYLTDHGVMVSGGRATKHPKGKDKAGFVRGTIFGFVWIAEPLSMTKIKLTYLMSMSPNGMIPAKAAEKANAAQVEKFKKIRALLEAK